MAHNEYVISYIDGNDLRYKSFATVADSQEKALKNLWKSYEGIGNFDHRIIEIKMEDK